MQIYAENNAKLVWPISMETFTGDIVIIPVDEVIDPATTNVGNH